MAGISARPGSPTSAPRGRSRWPRMCGRRRASCGSLARTVAHRRAVGGRRPARRAGRRGARIIVATATRLVPPILSGVALYRLDDPGPLTSPPLIVALDGWVDAGSAATTAATLIGGDGRIVATFDADRVYDYRARRPTLDIVDGRLTELDWPAFL